MLPIKYCDGMLEFDNVHFSSFFSQYGFIVFQYEIILQKSPQKKTNTKKHTKNMETK